MPITFSVGDKVADEGGNLYEILTIKPSKNLLLVKDSDGNTKWSDADSFDPATAQAKPSVEFDADRTDSTVEKPLSRVPKPRRTTKK